MNNLPSALEIERFTEDGVACLRGLIESSWIERLRAAIERDIANPGPHYHGYDVGGDGKFHGNLRLWEHDPDFKDYCFNSVLPEMASKFLRSDKVNLFYDQLFVKDPGTDSPTPWHHDQPFWPVRGRQIMSFWLALDTVTQNSGGLSYIKGSHKWNLMFQPAAFGKGETKESQASYELNPDYVPMPDIDAERGKYDFLDWDMEPGDVLAFHSLTVHGAPANASPVHRRRGYSVRYTGDDAVYYAGPGSNAQLRNAALNDGDPLDCEQFPVVWSGAQAVPCDQ